MEDEKDLLVYHFFRAYKVANSLSNMSNYNFIVNCNGSFLNRFFQKLTEEVLAVGNTTPYANMNTTAIFLRFLLRHDAVTFQAFFLVFNLAYYLLPHIKHHQILDILVLPMMPITVLTENSEEALTRYAGYCKLACFFEDLMLKLYCGKNVEGTKQKMSYKPMFLGEISKVIASCGTGALQDTRDSPLEEKYSVLEERRGIKTDIDLLLKHFHELSKRRNVLFRMRSTMNFDSDRKSGFEIEKTRFPEIFKKLKETKDHVIFVDYEDIKDREIYPKPGNTSEIHKTKLRSRSPEKSRHSKSPQRSKLGSDDSLDFAGTLQRRKSLQGRNCLVRGRKHS